MSRWLLLALTACGRVAFDPLTVGGDPTGDGGTMTGNGDGSMPGTDGGGGAPCTAPITCSFSGGFPPCTCWGSFTALNAGVSENAGTGLRITPNTNNANALGGCTRTATQIGMFGVTAEVSQVTTGTQSNTSLTIGNSNGPQYFQMSVAMGMLVMTDGSNSSTLTYGGSTVMRYWRIRPQDVSGTMFQTSSDGISWATHYNVAAILPVSDDVSISAGTPLADPAPGVAQFDHIASCE